MEGGLKSSKTFLRDIEITLHINLLEYIENELDLQIFTPNLMILRRTKCMLIDDAVNIEDPDLLKQVYIYIYIRPEWDLNSANNEFRLDALTD